MPELPEIEVLRRSLAPHLVGRTIEECEAQEVRLREPVEPRRLAAQTRGRRICSLRRRSKYLLIDVEGGSTLVVHLGMTGRLTLAPEGAQREVHEHVSFRLDGGQKLRFVDPRRFGQVFALATEKIPDDKRFAHLGIEPLDGELGGSFLQSAAKGRRGPVKPFLMDARVMVGVGNIYASEALFQAGIHPKRSVARISLARWEGLAGRVQQVLSRAIEEGGTTLNDFADGEGNSGYFQVSLAVYGREGEACQRCGATIRRIVQAGRASFYCVGCQR